MAAYTTYLESRIQRSKNEKIFLALIEKKHYQTEFTVFGSTANMYSVLLRNFLLPSCTCPDYLRGIVPANLDSLTDRKETSLSIPICKHICFVFLKIKRVSEQKFKQLIVQRFQTNYVVNDSNEHKNVDATLLAPKPAILALESLLATTNSDKKHEHDKPVKEEEKNRKIINGNCSICWDEMRLDDKMNLVFCVAQCGQNFHSSCITKLESVRKERREPMTCPLCRIPWVVNINGTEKKKSKKRKKSSRVNEEGYLNFQDLTQQPLHRIYKRAFISRESH